MPYKNAAVVFCIYAWDAVNGVPKTGDAANITVRGIGDGSEFTPAAPAVTEIDSTNAKGVYKVAFAAGENNYSFVMCAGVSSTAGVVIQPVQWTNECSVTSSAVASVSGNVGGNVVGNVNGNVVGSVGSVATSVTIAASQLYIKKNTALSNFTFVMTKSSTHQPFPGLGTSIVATRSIDGAAFGACANGVTELSNGWYKINLAAADLNGTVIGFKFTATAADDRDFTVVTQT